eukprot:scaffold159419_cov62-Cyclotella_meneghiniana.AAC.6
MSSKNSLHPRPWHPSCGMTPAQWHRMESNRIQAYHCKQRRSTFPFSGYQHAPPPTAFANIFNPPADSIQQQPNIPGFSQPAALLPAPFNPYQRPPLANLTNATIQSQPSAGSHPRKKSPVVPQVQSSNQTSLIPNHIDSSSADVMPMPANSNSSNSKAPTSKHAAVWHEGYQFTFHKRLKDGLRFRCSCQRSVKDCDIVLKHLSNGETVVSGSHGVGCDRRNGKKVETAPIESNDCTEQMHQWVEERSTEPDHLHDPPSKVIADCISHFTKEVGSNFHGMEKTQMRNLVYHSRERIFGSNVISTVETKYSGDERTAFLRHSSTFTDKEKMQRMMAFAWLSSAVEDLNPAFCGVDFEIAFFHQVAIHLPGVDLIGCLFHWKQAIRIGRSSSLGFQMMKYVLQ